MTTALERVNYPGIVAAILALVSIFQPWWGVNLIVLGTSNPVMYGLFGSPSGSIPPFVNDSFNQMMATYTPIILALAVITVGMSLLGSFSPRVHPLAASLFLGIATIVAFSLLLSYALTNTCGGNNCIRDLSGSRTFVLNTSATWGFQTGFYLFLAATIVIVVGMVYHQIQRAPKK